MKKTDKLDKEKDIAFLEYKGEMLPIRIRYRALKGFKADTGISFEEMSEGEAAENLENYEVLLYHALKSGFKVLEKEFTFGKDFKSAEENIVDIMDGKNTFFEFMDLVPLFFPNVEEVKKNRAQRRRDQKRK